MRSTYEVHAIIDLVIKLKLANNENMEIFRRELDEISAIIFSLVKKLRKKSDS